MPSSAGQALGVVGAAPAPTTALRCPRIGMKPSANWEQVRLPQSWDPLPRSRAPKSAPAWKQQNQASFGMRLVGTFNAKLQYFRFFFSPALGQDTSATATFLTGQSLRGPGSTGRLRFAGQVRQRTGSPCLHLSCQFSRQSLGQENAPQTTHGWGAPGRHPCLLQAGQRPGACPSNLPEGGLSVVAIPPVN